MAPAQDPKTKRAWPIQSFGGVKYEGGQSPLQLKADRTKMKKKKKKN